MRKALIPIAVLGVLAACTTTAGSYQRQIANTCANAAPFVTAVQTLDDGGTLTPKQHSQFEKAKVAYASFCAPGVQIVDWRDAVVQAAATYVILVQLKGAHT